MNHQEESIARSNRAEDWNQEMACIHGKCSERALYNCTSSILSTNTRRMVSQMCAFGTLFNPCNFHSTTVSTIFFNKIKFKILIWCSLNPGRSLTNLTDCTRITNFTLCFQIYGTTFGSPEEGRDYAVGMSTRHVLDSTGVESRWQRDFPHLSRPAFGPTQSPVEWVRGLISRGKAAGTWHWPTTPI
jgi:hypothetical protein